MTKKENLNLITVNKKYSDAEVKLSDFKYIELKAYLNPDNLQFIEARIPNNPNAKRYISTNKEIPYVKIFPEELLIVPLGVDIEVPIGYILIIEPDFKLSFNIGIDLEYNTFFFNNDEDYLILNNQSGSIKEISHGQTLGYARLIKTETFDIRQEGE